MKARIASEVFTTAVSRGTRNVPARPVAPVRAGVLLSATHDTLTISSFDDEVSTRVRLPATVAEPGAVVASGRLLAEMVKFLPTAPVELTADGGQLRIACGSADFALPLLPVEDYPALSEVPVSSGTVAVTDFARAVAQTAVAASKDDTVPVLTGVRLELRGDTMRLSSTDRYRMAISEVPWEAPGIERSVLLPGTTLSALARMLDGQRLSVGIQDGAVGFECDGVSVVSRTMDSALPDLETHVHFEARDEVRVDTAALLESVRRVSFAAPRSGAVGLRVADNHMTVTSGEDLSAQASDTVECRSSGQGVRIAFNKSYLQDCLKTMPSSTTVVSVASDGSRVLFTPDTGGSYRHLIMPLRKGM